MILLNDTGNLISREERKKINDNWQLIIGGLTSLQRQITILAGGQEVDDLLNAIAQAIADAETTTMDMLLLIDAVDLKLVEMSDVITNAEQLNDTTRDFIAELTTLKNELSDLKSSLETSEIVRTENELIRETNETQRIANEEQRVTAEAQRDSIFESTMEIADYKITELDNLKSTLRTSEVEREENEDRRIQDEDIRVQNESARQVVNAQMQALIDNLQSVDYSPDVTYDFPTLVSYNGSTYIALQQVTGITPSDDKVNYRLIAQRGVDGTGSVSSVNGVSPDVDGNVTINSTSIGAIPTLEKGVANGVAKLNADGKVVDANGNEVEGKVTSVNGQVGDVEIDIPTIDTSNLVLKDGTVPMQSLTIGVRSSSSVVGKNSFAQGDNVVAQGSCSFAQGGYSEAKETFSFAIGDSSKASRRASFAGGTRSNSYGMSSISFGENAIAKARASFAMGRCNRDMVGSEINIDQTDTALIIGNGLDWENLSNAFRVTFDGKTYGLSAFNSTGADYAEYFEWLDGNIDDLDMVGYVVTLDGDKIRKATATDEYILGIISVNPSVIGDSYQDDWSGKYVTDEWGRIQYHYVDVDYDEIEHDENEDIVTITKTRQDYVPILSPDWNNEEEYVPREKRKEWDAVGLVGKLLVRDDGTCIVNGYAKVGRVDGELTASETVTNMRVMERVSDNIVRVFIK